MCVLKGNPECSVLLVTRLVKLGRFLLELWITVGVVSTLVAAFDLVSLCLVSVLSIYCLLGPLTEEKNYSIKDLPK